MLKIKSNKPIFTSAASRTFASAEVPSKVTGPKRGDIKLITSSKLNFGDVLIVPQKSFVHSRSRVGIQCEYEFKYSPHKWSGVPIMSSNMDTVTNEQTAAILSDNNWISVFPKHFNQVWHARNSNFLPPVLAKVDTYALSCGTSNADIAAVVETADHIEEVFGQRPKMVCVDIANGYLDVLVQKCQRIRDVMPDVILMAGNVVTPEGLYELVHKGSCDVVKVGIGSGAACTTRLKTGVGYPQFSAVVECAAAAQSYGCHIISDGGAVFAGDCAKAFAANASFVMLGSMLAGHIESPGELIIDEETGKKYKEYYGMSSKRANEKFFGGLQTYRAAEGKLTHIPVKGHLLETIQDIEGGIRSACTYVNAESLEELSQNAVFVEVKQQYNGSLDQYVVGRI